ncbi:MAG: endopeptidase La [Vicinamibacteraceae bacterium]|nr:endopeptidase La [Vicinamibacteraceae bacterium]
MADTSTPVASPPSSLPIVPLRRTVVFPLTVQPLAVNRPVSIDGINRALASDRQVLLVMQHGDEEDPQPSDLKSIGTVGVIRQMTKSPAGLHVLVEGLHRVRLVNATRDGVSMKADIEPYPDPEERSIEVDAYVRRVKELVDRAVSLASGLSPELRGLLLSIEDPLRLVYLLASMLDMKHDDKQALLETDQVTVKLSAVAGALSREIALLELKGKIESQAQQEMSDAQREYYLRQQLKAIQEELGESEGEENRDLRERLEQANLPEHVKTAAMREAKRLERMPQASPEYQMVRTYLEWILEMPWAVMTEDRLDPVAARRVLDEDHYDLDKVKDRIVEYLAVRKLKGDMKGPILCFVGPPGVGKTSLGQSIARAMNRKFVRISLGGVRDEAEVRGHRRTYIGAIPGRIIQAMKQAGSMNPVFMLDEIDKVSAGGFSGDPAAALLEVLDPAQNSTFRDHYLEVNMDLSKVLFIATANQLGTIHPALLDRMEIIALAGYTEDEKLHIARRYLLPRQLSEHGLTSAQLRIEDAAIRRIIAEYTREAGVRNLERQIGTVARKVAARVATALVEAEHAPATGDPNAVHVPVDLARDGARAGEPTAGVAGGAGDETGPDAPPEEQDSGTIATPEPRVVSAAIEAAAADHVIEASEIPDFLGPPRFKPETAFRTSRPGVATGVAWTESGGEVLFIEASLLPGGRGTITLTGQLGGVMQESARAAVSHIRANAEALGVRPTFLDKCDLHVHVPAGAIPKDGPSAGVTMATAILSAIRRVPVRDDVAMTGEITLSGLVLPVGGIREKALAAKRHGVTTFILPAQNESDLAELAPELKDGLTFVPVSTLEAVLAVALPTKDAGAGDAPADDAPAAGASDDLAEPEGREPDEETEAAVAREQAPPADR